MQLTSRQYYLVKTDESYYYFYLNKDREVCYKVFNMCNELIDEQRLVAQTIIDFSVAINHKNQIHLVCIAQEGQLLYYIQQQDNWSHKCLSKLDVRSNNYRHLQLIICKGYYHLFFSKTNLLNSMVSTIEHIYWNEQTMNKTAVTTYLPGKYPSPYQVAIDRDNDIHLVYKVFFKDNHQLYYNKFNSFNEKWSPNEIISNLQEDHCHPYMFIDQQNNLHLAWCTIEQNNFILKYRKKVNISSIKSKWSPVQVLSSKNANNYSPLIIQDGAYLKIFTKQNHQICEIISQNFGDDWIITQANKIYKLENPQLFQYVYNWKSNTVQSAKHIYGEINEQINVIGLNLFKPTNYNHFMKSNELNSIKKNNTQILASSDIITSTEENIIKNSISHQKDNIESSITSQEKNVTLEQLNINDSTLQLINSLQFSVSEIMEQVKELQQQVQSLNSKNGIEKKIMSSKKELPSKDEALKEQLSFTEEEQILFRKEIENFQIQLDEINQKVDSHKELLVKIEEQLQSYSKKPSLLRRFIELFK